MSADAWRIIDANLNRIAEGLRVLEDVARLVLNDAGLSQPLKDMRHEMVRTDWPVQQQLIMSRDAAGDVGINLEVNGKPKERDLPATVVANARRVQESLRVIEEMAKTPGVKLDSDKFKHARFRLYTLEKDILSRLLLPEDNDEARAEVTD